MNHALIFNVHDLGLRRPPGAHRIATILRDEGWDVEVIDFANNWSLEQLKEFAKSHITSNTVFVGYSIMFDMWGAGPMEPFSSWLRTTYANVKQVIGGQWPPIHDSSCIDYYVTGYGENGILELVKHMTGNGGVIKFDPKYFGQGKKVLSGNKFYPSFPMKSLLIKYETRDYIEPYEWLTVEFSRGCKFSCPYCTYPILGVKGDYSRDAEDFRLQMQDTYDRFGVSHYFAADETFNDRSEKIVKFADAVDQLNFKPWFSGFIRADLLVSRKDDWEHLSRMGFLGQFYGVETFNHETAKSIKKGMHPDKLKAGLLDAKNYFRNTGQGLYRGLIALVLGLPHETKDTINSAFTWLEENWEGEAITVTGLEIPTDPTKDVLSEMSLNWAEYGYSDQESPIIVPGDNVNERVRKSQSLMNSKLNWKNEHLTYEESVKIAGDWVTKGELAQKFGCSVYVIDYYMFMGLDLKGALNHRVPVVTESRYKALFDKSQFEINKYIFKKLN